MYSALVIETHERVLKVGNRQSQSFNMAVRCAVVVFCHLNISTSWAVSQLVVSQLNLSDNFEVSAYFYAFVSQVGTRYLMFLG